MLSRTTASSLAGCSRVNSRRGVRHQPLHMVVGTIAFVWRRVMRHDEAAGITLGSIVSCAIITPGMLRHALNLEGAMTMALLCGPLVTALLARRRVLLWGAVTCSALLAYFLLLSTLVTRSFFITLLELAKPGLRPGGWTELLVSVFWAQGIALMPTLLVWLVRHLNSAAYGNLPPYRQLTKPWITTINRQRRRMELIAEITAAFDGVQREDGTSLCEGETVDSGTRWQDVPHEKVANLNHSGFRFFDPQGFRYYLPVYLIWYLMDEGGRGKLDDDTGLVHAYNYQSVPFFLNRYVENLQGHYRDHIALLSDEQSAAVAHFLQYLVECREAEAAWEERQEESAVAWGETTIEEARANRLFRRAGYATQNHERQALERYWAQFL